MRKKQLEQKNNSSSFTYSSDVFLTEEEYKVIVDCLEFHRDLNQIKSIIRLDNFTIAIKVNDDVVEDLNNFKIHLEEVLGINE